MLEDFLPEMGLVDVHVYLCSADVLMSEHGLYGPEVGSSLQELRGKAVAEDVRADAVGFRHGAHILLDGFADVVASEWRTVSPDEKDL